MGPLLAYCQTASVTPKGTSPAALLTHRRPRKSLTALRNHQTDCVSLQIANARERTPRPTVLRRLLRRPVNLDRLPCLARRRTLPSLRLLHPSTLNLAQVSWGLTRPASQATCSPPAAATLSSRPIRLRAARSSAKSRTSTSRTPGALPRPTRAGRPDR